MCPKTQSWIPAAFTPKTTASSPVPLPQCLWGIRESVRQQSMLGRLGLKVGFKFRSYLFAMGHCWGQNCDGSEFIR